MPLRQTQTAYNQLIRLVSLPYLQPGHELSTIDVELHIVYTSKPFIYKIEKQQWFDAYIEDKNTYRVATHKDLLHFIGWLFK